MRLRTTKRGAELTWVVLYTGDRDVETDFEFFETRAEAERAAQEFEVGTAYVAEVKMQTAEDQS